MPVVVVDDELDEPPQPTETSSKQRQMENKTKNAGFNYYSSSFHPGLRGTAADPKDTLLIV